MKKYFIFAVIVILLGIISGLCYIKFVDNDLSISENAPYYTINVSNTNENNDNVIIVNLPENADNTEYKLYEGDFELPLNSSTGFASVNLPLYKASSLNPTSIIKTIKAGTAFMIIKEENDFFYVELSDSTKGYIESKYVLVNLPDLIPSIIYDDTNSYKSMFLSSGYELENVTGKALYNVKMYNERLQEEQYIMPLLYPMAKKIATIQKDALKNGDTLKIYETFRPYEVQMKVSDSLSKLMEENAEVEANINSKPWDKSWFIAPKLSNHQRGVALDVSLAKVIEKEYKTTNSYTYLVVSEYKEYTMPTKMHELSKAAATFTTPVNSKSKTAWKSAKYATTMTESAIKLQNYFTSYGLTPLASEWWHFNDLDTKELTKDNSSTGKYYLTEILSKAPSEH